MNVGSGGIKEQVAPIAPEVSSSKVYNGCSKLEEWRATQEASRRADVRVRDRACAGARRILRAITRCNVIG